MEAIAPPFRTAFAHPLGPTDPCSTAVHMEPFSYSAFKALVWIFATTTKICTRGGSTHALGFHATHCGASETCRWCAPLQGWGIPPEPAGASLHLHCAVGARGHPLTRACIRLLGPCFKTGWVGGRPHRGPRAPFTRAWSPPWLRGAVGDGLRTIRPGQRTCRETQSAFEVSMINVSCNSH